MKRLPTLVFILSLALCLATEAFAQLPHSPTPCHVGELWTTKYPASTFPAGSFIHIPQGQTIVLNTTTVPLAGLLVEGTLVFDHTVPSGTVHLRTAYAIVTGTLQAGCMLGSTMVRFTKNAKITLVSPEAYSGPMLFHATAGVSWLPEMETLFGSHPHIKEAAFDRGLIIAGSGRFEVYGAHKGVSWTTLAATVPAAATSLTTDGAIDAWKDTDELLLASTDFEYPDPQHLAGREPDYGQDELFSPVGFGAGGHTILVSPLTHGHYAATEVFTFPGGAQDSITMKAELANLTRSVVIQGEASAYSSQHRTGGFGTEDLGHVALMEYSGARPTCKVEWAEFRDLGVEAKLGRYPFHFHELPNYATPPAEADMSYLKN